MEARKYRRKPIIVEAIQYTGDNKTEIMEFTHGEAHPLNEFEKLMVLRVGRVKAGDWIVKHNFDMIFSIPDDTFEDNYETVIEE